MPANSLVTGGAGFIGSGEELAYSVAGVMDVDPCLIHLPPRIEVLGPYSSPVNQHRVFGTFSFPSLDDGLNRMARGVREHGAHTSQPFEDIEACRSLSTAWT